MSRFLVYDPHNVGFYKDITKRVDDIFDAKHWRRKHAAIEAASLLNVSRNIPPGHLGPSKHYRDLPNAEVVEFDERWVEIARHPAPPNYISITMKG